MSIIIGLIGQKLTGKDTIANYLKDRYSAVSFAGGHILNDILKILGQGITRENEIALAVKLREAFGEEVLNSAILHRLQESQAKIGLINGIRRPKELDQAHVHGVRTVYISATPEIRYERYRFRQEKRDDGVLDFEHFMKQDAQSPTEIDIPAIGARAEFTIENAGNLADLYSEVDALMQKILNSK